MTSQSASSDASVDESAFYSCPPSTTSTAPVDGVTNVHQFPLATEPADGSSTFHIDDYTSGALQTDEAVTRVMWLLNTAQDVGPHVETNIQVHANARDLFTINLYRGHLPVAGRNYYPYLLPRHQIGRRCTAIREVIEGYRYSTIFPSVGLPIHFHPQDLAAPRTKPKHYLPTETLPKAVVRERDTEGVYLDATVGTT
eukprot:2109181-Amphidinium_carterae.1